MAEAQLYPLAKQTLEDFFRARGFECKFQILGQGPYTGKGKKPPGEFLFANPALVTYASKLPVPDIMGVVWRTKKENRKLVIAEVKERPNFGNVFQTKGYHELFKARLSFLLSRLSISEKEDANCKPRDETTAAMWYITHDPRLIRARTLVDGSESESKILCVFLQDTKDGKAALARLASDYVFDWYTEMDTLERELQNQDR